MTYDVITEEALCAACPLLALIQWVFLFPLLCALTTENTFWKISSLTLRHLAII